MQKSIIYTPIPEFDQMTQFVKQMLPADMGDHFFVGIEVYTAYAVYDAVLEELLLEEMGV